MSRRWASTHVELEVWPAGRELSPARSESATRLFSRQYADYHYLPEVGSSAALRVLAISGAEVAGYAAYVRAGAYGKLANLLVDDGLRGLGIGRRLEERRLREVRAAGLRVYVSTVCGDTASQHLKLEHGLTPVCLKIGYRTGVRRAGEVGSAVVFTDAAADVVDVVERRLVVDRRLRRSRLLADDARQVEDFAAATQGYADVLVDAPTARELRDWERLAFCGRDLDLPTGRWYYCFQVRNERYAAGLAQHPRLAVPVGDIRGIAA